jgi:hypothetical protein
LEDLTPFKYKKAMSNLTDFYNSTNLKMRHNIVRPIRKSGFKYSEIRKIDLAIQLLENCGFPVCMIEKEKEVRKHFYLKKSLLLKFKVVVNRSQII